MTFRRLKLWKTQITKMWLKPGIHYANFALISPRFYSLNKLTLVEESQSQPADYSWQIPQKISVYYGHRLLFFNFRLWFYPVGGYQTCLIFSADFRTQMFSFLMRLLATRCMFLREFVVIGTTLKSGSVWSSDTYCMIFRHVLYDAQFSFVTIYKVGKCMMPSVLKICSDCKSNVVYSSLKTIKHFRLKTD